VQHADSAGSALLSEPAGLLEHLARDVARGSSVVVDMQVGNVVAIEDRFEFVRARQEPVTPTRVELTRFDARAAESTAMHRVGPR